MLKPNFDSVFDSIYKVTCAEQTEGKTASVLAYKCFVLQPENNYKKVVYHPFITRLFKNISPPSESCPQFSNTSQNNVNLPWQHLSFINHFFKDG